MIFIKHKITYLFCLLSIFVIALLLRTYQLSTQPPGLTWDEAALGYNAYSILKTGKDEHGITMPIIFKSFGDYKPGLYAYLTIPSVALLGLNEYSVRLPSAVAGALSCLFLSLVIYSFFKNKAMALLSGLVLALMPWHIHFSRGAWETNVYVFFVILGIYLFQRAVASEKTVIFSTLVFFLSIYLYQGAKLITPLVFLGLLVYNRLHNPPTLGRFFSREKKLIPFYLLIIAFLAIYTYQASTGPAGNRLTRLSLFNYRPGSDDSALFHSLPDQWLRMVASRYLNHFSPELLFSGQIQVQRDTLGKLGMLHLLDGVWLLSGFIFLALNPYRRSSLLFLYFLVIAPLGGSLTLSEFSTVRSEVLVFPLAAIIGMGIYQVFRFPRIGLILFFIYAHFLILDTDIYLNHSQGLLAEGYNYGHKQAVEIIKSASPDKIVFTDVYGQPYIYYLFYTKYDPATFQRLRTFKDGGVDVGSVPGFANLEFRQPQYGDLATTPNSIFVGTYDNFPDRQNFNQPYIDTVSDIKDPTNKIVFRVIKTSNK